MPVSTVAGKPPVDEIGAVMQGMFSPAGMAPWTSFVDEVEWVPELIWPASVQKFEEMRSDSQLAALYNGTTLPIRHWEWSIDPNGADDDMVEAVAQDLNLPILGEDPRPRLRQKRRFNFDQHIRKALYAGIYGHYYFEQVGEIRDGQWHVRKLAERPPRTIQEISVATDGGLVYIKQNISKNFGMGAGAPYDMPTIPVDRLVAYVWEQEGANWVGRSWFRDVYKNWLIKDRLVRVDAVNHQRAGGVPYAVGPPGATPAEVGQLHQLAREFRIGESAGGAIPHGSELFIARASGSDTVASIRYHDEAMARKFLLMVLQLGQTQTGSRALGTTFVDFFSRGLDTVGIWFRDTFNEHVIEDFIDWNYGENVENCPMLHFEHDPDLDVQSLTQLIDSGAIIVDLDLETALRKELGLVNKMPGAPSPKSDVEMQEEISNQKQDQLPPGAPGGQPPVQGRRGRVDAVEDVPSLPLPDRPLRRQPYEHEIRAAVDFSMLDTAWQAEVGRLVTEWMQVRAAQADELHDAIVAAGGNVKKLSKISAQPRGATLILSRLQAIASIGANEALKEAVRQGMVQPTMPDLSKLEKGLLARAEAVESLLASALGESARSKAIHLSGGGLTASEVAQEVKLHLNSLSDVYLTDQLGGAMSSALNEGRLYVMHANEAVRYYASELLDVNTCERCVVIDGREYDSPTLATKDYPTGGYKDCLGGPRCRGTLVAIYQTEEV
jgi:hypothetical protein